MHNSINSANNVNFTARLNLKKFDLSPKKNKNITRIFEQRTRKFPNDVFEVNQVTDNDIEMFLTFKNRKDIEIAEIKNFQELFQQPDKIVAKKLETFFYILKKENEMIPSLQKIGKSMPEEKYMDFWKLTTEAQDITRKNIVANDPILKNIEIN